MRSPLVAEVICVISLIPGLIIKGILSCGEDLTAQETPSITFFNQTLPSPHTPVFLRKHLVCTWLIDTGSKNWVVHLSINSFHLFSNEADNDGDCISIFDGRDISSTSSIASICEELPEQLFSSTGQYLTVVFMQGSLAGQRWFSMNYTAVRDPPDEKIFWKRLEGIIFNLFSLIFISLVFCFLCGKSNYCNDSCRVVHNFFKSVTRCYSLLMEKLCCPCLIGRQLDLTTNRQSNCVHSSNCVSSQRLPPTPEDEEHGPPSQLIEVSELTYPNPVTLRLFAVDDVLSCPSPPPPYLASHMENSAGVFSPPSYESLFGNSNV